MRGVGKSSMIKLIRAALEQRDAGQSSKFVFVEFNAWLYQGYDDARAAFIEVIATTLAKEAEARKTALNKTKELLERVDWFRTAKLAGSAAALFIGVPPLALAGEVLEFGKRMIAGQVSGEELTKLEGKISEAGTAAAGLLKPITAQGDSRHPPVLRDEEKAADKKLYRLKVRFG
jgi:predicted KAP-like P-loop ATPase